MRKQSIDEARRCPKCRRKENQILQGYTEAGTQRCKCKECDKTYALNPKKREYSEETREQAIKMYYSGVSGRGVGNLLNMNKSNVYRWIKKTAK